MEKREEKKQQKVDLPHNKTKEQIQPVKIFISHKGTYKTNIG